MNAFRMTNPVPVIIDYNRPGHLVELQSEIYSLVKFHEGATQRLKNRKIRAVDDFNFVTWAGYARRFGLFPLCESSECWQLFRYNTSFVADFWPYSRRAAVHIYLDDKKIEHFDHCKPFPAILIAAGVAERILKA